MAINDCISLYKQRDYGSAVECFSEQLKDDPESHDLNYCLGVALFEKGEFNTAADYFKKANAIDEDDLCAYYAGLCYFNQLDFEDAAYFFKKSKTLQPMSAEAHFMMSLCHLYSNDLDNFSKFLKRAIMIDDVKTKTLAQRFIGMIKRSKNAKKLLKPLMNLLNPVI